MRYQNYVFDDHLISPINGYKCKKITRQNVKQFGFTSIDDLLHNLPGFPLTCSKLAATYRIAFVKAGEKGRLKQQVDARERRGDRECETCSSGLTSRDQTRFCSRSCAATHNNKSNLDRSKQRETLITRAKISYNARPSCCSICNEVLPYEQRRRTRCGTHAPAKHSSATLPMIRLCANCSDPCPSAKAKYCGMCKTNIRHYRSLCSFRFNVYHFPDDFDLSLLAAHGWFSPNGRNGRNPHANLNGVSRDHIYSVADGFKENRPSEMLAHPANCRLMIHNGPTGNNSKKRSDISWEELLARIDKWNATH